MTEEERRRCCLLGGCGCNPGSPAQRQAWEEFLLAKLADGLVQGSHKLTVAAWLDELPWGEQGVTLTGPMVGFALQAGDAANQAREDGKKEDRREALSGMIEFLQRGLENP